MCWDEPIKEGKTKRSNKNKIKQVPGGTTMRPPACFPTFQTRFCSFRLSKQAYFRTFFWGPPPSQNHGFQWDRLRQTPETMRRWDDIWDNETMLETFETIHTGYLDIFFRFRRALHFTYLWERGLYRLDAYRAWDIGNRYFWKKK